MKLRPARLDDCEDILSLRHAAEDWLADRCIDQWPAREVPLDTVRAQVARGEFLVATRARGSSIIAAMRLLASDPEFWDYGDASARYVHSLMIKRDCAGTGLGARMLAEAADLARADGARLLRLDCAETNLALRQYYRARGFAEVGRRDVDGRFSVTLFEKTIVAVS